MRLYSLSVLCLCFLVFTYANEENEEEFPDVNVEDDGPPKEEYVAPLFQRPTVNTREFHFIEWFDDVKGIGKKWIKSIAKKEGAEESLAKYNGEWAIGGASKLTIENDYGLIVKTKARHHAIAASLARPFNFDGKPLAVQYEVKYEDGQECGGGYVKLLSANDEKVENFHDRTPYTIMFGPDKCGVSSKVHFIIRHKNPKNGTISEHHAKQSTKSLSSYFEDGKTHLYRLVVEPDNTYRVTVDRQEIMSGSLLDLEPSITPPLQIFDPTDVKPADWDEREYIVDPEAKKPDDWDESAPKEILDEEATKPADWLEDEEPLIPDPEATQPEDWDEKIDGEWEPKKIPNLKCEGLTGCGKWVRPMKPNPQYKGKWSPPKIFNPAYKGKWSARLIDNPHYFKPSPYSELAPIGAVGFELWTMSANIIFDNIIVADDEELAEEFAKQTFDVKTVQEKLFEQVNNPPESLVSNILETTKEKPWLWAVFVLVLLIPVIFISVYCFGSKSTPSYSSRAKKTDEAQADDLLEDEIVMADGAEGADEQSASEGGSVASDTVGFAPSEPKKKEKVIAKEAHNDKGDAPSQPQEASAPSDVGGSPAGPTRRARIRRQD